MSSPVNAWRLSAKPSVRLDRERDSWVCSLAFSRYAQTDITYATIESSSWRRAWSLAWRATEWSAGEVEHFYRLLLHQDMRAIGRMSGWDDGDAPRQRSLAAEWRP